MRVDDRPVRAFLLAELVSLIRYEDCGNQSERIKLRGGRGRCGKVSVTDGSGKRRSSNTFKALDLDVQHPQGHRDRFSLFKKVQLEEQ